MNVYFEIFEIRFEFWKTYGRQDRIVYNNCTWSCDAYTDTLQVNQQ